VRRDFQVAQMQSDRGVVSLPPGINGPRVSWSGWAHQRCSQATLSDHETKRRKVVGRFKEESSCVVSASGVLTVVSQAANKGACESQTSLIAVTSRASATRRSLSLEVVGNLKKMDEVCSLARGVSRSRGLSLGFHTSHPGLQVSL